MIKEKTTQPFLFKEFCIEHDQCAMQVGTDGILLGAWANVTNVHQVLDIGTGSGVIAIMLAQRTQAAHIHGVEVDEASFLQAKQNMESSSWHDRLTAIHQPIQTYASTSDVAYDLIVSNPPFFSGGTFSLNENKKNVRHTVKLPHGELLIAARKLLKQGGKFCLILPLIEGLRIKELAKNYRLFCTKITSVKPRPDQSANRLLMQFEKQANDSLIEDELIVYASTAGNAYSEEYKSLTDNFYLDM